MERSENVLIDLVFSTTQLHNRTDKNTISNFLHKNKRQFLKIFAMECMDLFKDFYSGPVLFSLFIFWQSVWLHVHWHSLSYWTLADTLHEH